MSKDNERITYDEFMMMFKIAPSMCYTLYEKAEDEIENLQKKAELGEHYKHLYSEVKKQKDEIFKYIKSFEYYIPEDHKNELLRMLGEIDVE